MATVRTAEEEQKKIIIGIGYGAREHIAELRAFAEKINAGIGATRKMVDSDYLPYELQVGLYRQNGKPRCIYRGGYFGRGTPYCRNKAIGNGNRNKHG